jgi:F-type H+-transporting ATPase subunit a
LGLSEELKEKLNIADKSFDILPGSGEFHVPQSCIITWLVMLVLVILAIIFTRKMEVIPRGKQAVFESFINMLYRFFYGILGEEGKRFIPYILTVILYLGVSNMLGLVGIAPPTKDLNVTAGLAIMSIILVIYAGISSHGFGGWLKSFTQPLGLITPLNVLEIGIKPLSLCMRLFGNILGAYIIMEVIIYCIPSVVPLIASAYFDIFDGLLQAFIFCFLTSMYLHEAIE